MSTTSKIYWCTKRWKKKPTIQDQLACTFNGYDAGSLMTETAKLRKLIMKRGTLEILIPLCCTTNPVRYMKFRQTLKGFSSKILTIRLKELKGGILERQAYHEIPSRVENRIVKCQFLSG